MHIVQSTPQDIDTLFQLYDEATAYMRQVGKKVWLGFERAMVEQEIAEGRQFKIVEGAEVVCVFVITWNDPLIWKEKDADPSIYIHRIATRAAYRGNGYVKHIVAWVQAYAREHGRKFVRMDTGAGNERLNNYYVGCGFRYLGTTMPVTGSGLPAHYEKGEFSLFEMEV